MIKIPTIPLFAAIALLLSSYAHAEVIPVLEYSFESPSNGNDFVVDDVAYVNDPDSSWTRWGHWGIQDWENGSFYGATQNARELGLGLGYQSAYVNAGGVIFQNVGALESDTIYTLTVAIGRRLDKTHPNTIELAFYNGEDVSGTLLASAWTDALLAPGEFIDYSISYRSGSSVEGDLVIALDNRGNSVGHTVIDNVRLEKGKRVSIPEPSTYGAVVGMCCFGVVMSRRRRRFA